MFAKKDRITPVATNQATHDEIPVMQAARAPRCRPPIAQPIRRDGRTSILSWAVKSW